MEPLAGAGVVKVVGVDSLTRPYLQKAAAGPAKSVTCLHTRLQLAALAQLVNRQSCVHPILSAVSQLQRPFSQTHLAQVVIPLVVCDPDPVSCTLFISLITPVSCNTSILDSNPVLATLMKPLYQSSHLICWVPVCMWSTGGAAMSNSTSVEPRSCANCPTADLCGCCMS